MKKVFVLRFIILIILVVLMVIVAYLSLSNKPPKNLTEIPISDIQIHCINFYIQDKEFVINSDDEYKQLLDYKDQVGHNCANYTLPSIDFSQYTLLGKDVRAGGCSIDFSKKAYKDNQNKKIIYSIKINTKGLCKKLGMSMNWGLIPKVPEDYSVQFEVIRENQ